MKQDKLISVTRAVTPYLICIALCVAMAHAQDSISDFSHNSRSFTQVFAVFAGYIILFVGLSAVWMRRSTRIGIASLVVGAGLLIGSEIYDALSRAL
jgi:hypothetical protein